MPIDLTGRVAVVTGAAGRLGTVWSGALLSAGADVLGLDLGASVPDALADLPAGSGRYLPLAADVTSRASLQEALATCLDELGSPTILVNNAGIDHPPSAERGGWTFADVPEESVGSILDVNVRGVLLMCQVFGVHMAEQGRGSVINIGSLYGNVAPYPPLYDHIPLDPPFLKHPAYGMSKGAVHNLTRYLAAYWGADGVRVNTLSPGGVLGGQDPEFRRKFAERVPMGRMAVDGDLTGPLLFLASELSGYVTGQELLLDGGYVSW
ncbi:SDR family oxidoreductase [Kitasatospora sp. CB01950]|uniref:SDR family oxidoreductase n=1 Tax=Kitasatospora sp. CB01950 TaxID=1703930 RepID=UPI00093C24CB|nr:SDR family oxidoreductase [Kitasatospora sp. CB01950]OKJ16941.1 dehydrogenase [Kitasatospora sp. CB01950]